ADAIHRFPTPTLRALAATGVRSKGMIPAMPSMTFVNLYSLATGLHPEHHGFTSNFPYDRKLGRAFDRARDAQNPVWWGGEPIWITAEKQGVKSATYFWVGSEVAYDGVRPTFWKTFDREKEYGERVTEMLSWFAKPAADRPRFASLYFSAVNRAAHDFGVGSDQERAAVALVDRHVGDLITGMKKLGLYEQTNIIIVSDHGFTNLADDRVINLDKIVDLSQLTIPDWHPGVGPVYLPFMNVYGDSAEIKIALKALKGAHPNMQIHERGNFPEAYHFDHPDRAPDFMILADVGWALYASEGGNKPLPAVGSVPGTRGTHGYDNRHQDMHATFIAAGPKFNRGQIVESFENIEVYGILACALGISPARTDGNIKNVAHFLKDPCN
ncbi:MAG: ectonucleotide pyrophosphatase/phosphodiesterase, partial [Kordiimonadaceae bacterium]|nr:ectonucleotide pyrophosphatase/phosphodiesterase [Kordiimonadaceae bacterium]